MATCFGPTSALPTPRRAITRSTCSRASTTAPTTPAERQLQPRCATDESTIAQRTCWSRAWRRRTSNVLSDPDRSSRAQERALKRQLDQPTCACRSALRRSPTHRSQGAHDIARRDDRFETALSDVREALTEITGRRSTAQGPALIRLTATPQDVDVGEDGTSRTAERAATALDAANHDVDTGRRPLADLVRDRRLQRWRAAPRVQRFHFGHWNEQ